MIDKSDFDWLISYGYTVSDVKKIKDAYRYILYFYPTMEKKVSAAKARDILGDSTYLSGLAKAVTSKRCIRCRNGKYVVFVDKRFI